MTVLDRFEGSFAVLSTENGTIRIHAGQLPDDACEGDILVRRGGKWSADKKETEARRALIREKLRSLMRDNDD